MGQLKTLTINGTTYSVASVVPATSVTIYASAWIGSGTKYSQEVTVPGVTSHTKVDLQPTTEQLVEFHEKILVFTTVNDGGVVKVYAIGDKPKNDHTIQITLTEVDGTGPIRGNTVGTTMPRANLNQTDPTKADYVEGREMLENFGAADSFVGNENTTLDEFYEAYQDNKVCFMIRPGGGAGIVTWVMYTANTSFARFYQIDANGNTMAGTLRSNGEWTHTTFTGSGSVSEEQIIAALESYLEDHPIEGGSGVYVLAEGETIEDVPADADVVIDPNGTPTEIPTDDHINSLIDAKLGVIENGTY